jgi:hypothetical protein
MRKDVIKTFLRGGICVLVGMEDCPLGKVRNLAAFRCKMTYERWGTNTGMVSCDGLACRHVLKKYSSADEERTDVIDLLNNAGLK